MQSNVAVEEFTTPDPVTVSEDTPMDELRRQMDAHGIRHLPVLRDGEVTGIISDRDLRLIEGLSLAEKFQVRAGDIMAAEPVSVAADTPLDEAAYLMSERKIGSVLVKDPDGRFLGIFTLTDALNALIEVVRATRSAR